jgi:hypothetical protein
MGFSETTISVKAVHAGDIRRFPFPVEGGHALLQQKLNELFNFAPPQELKVYWQDEQNDQVSVTNDEELGYAISVQGGSALLRLVITLNKSSTCNLIPTETNLAEAVEVETTFVKEDVVVDPLDLDDDVAPKLLQAVHRVKALEARTKSNNFDIFDDAYATKVVFCEGKNGFAEYELPAACVHESLGFAELLVKYASGDPRPLRLMIDGELLGSICVTPTSGFSTDDLQWRTHQPFQLDFNKPHVIRIETDEYFPHVSEFVLVPTEGPGLLGADQEFNARQAVKGSSKIVELDVTALCGVWGAVEWSCSEFNAVDESVLLWNHDVALFEHGGGCGPMDRSQWHQDEENKLWVTTPDDERIEFELGPAFGLAGNQLRVRFQYDEPGWILYERVDAAADELESRVSAALDAVSADSRSESSDDSDAMLRFSAVRNGERDQQRAERTAERRRLQEKLALAKRWTKFLPHPSPEQEHTILIDGSNIANDLGHGRHAQMLVVEHVRKAVPITQLSYRIVFGGAAGKWAKKFSAENIELIFTHNRSVQDVLCEQAARNIVVTCNHTVALAVLAAGGKIMKAKRFHVLTDTDSEDSSSDSSSSSSSSSSSESSDSEHEHHRRRRRNRNRRG